MKNVFYSIRKVRNSDDKISGLGFLNDEGTLSCKAFHVMVSRKHAGRNHYCFTAFISRSSRRFNQYATLEKLECKIAELFRQIDFLKRKKKHYD